VAAYPPNTFVEPVTGFCGLVLPSHPASLVIGLGQERERAIGLKEEVDPKVVAAFLSRPATDPNFERAVIAANRDYLADVGPTLRFYYPVRDFVTTFHRLLGVTRALRRETAVVLVPLGPKIFALACFVVALVDREVSVWRVSAGPREKSVDRHGVGPPIYAELHWTKN
jgi:hypothetical protein